MTGPQLLLTAIAAWLCLPTPCWSQPNKRLARVVVLNADELATTGSDAALAKDIVSALDETDLWHLNVHRGNDQASPAQRTLLLITLASPEEISTSAQRNAGFAVGPVTDFNRFVEAIDYGEVVRRDDRQWIASVRVDPKELETAKLLARAQATGRRPLGLQKLRSRQRGSSASRPLASSAGLGGGSLDDVSVGDTVAFDLAGEPFQGAVEAVDDDETRVRVEDLKKLSSLLGAPLRKRLRRADELSIWFPAERLSVVSAAADATSSGLAQRTWTDKSGKFQVIATYGGVSGEKVRLTKPSGKEILVPIDRLSDEDRAYVLQAKEGRVRSDNPFAVAENQAPRQRESSRSLRADWSRIKTIQGREFPRWSFTPPETATPRSKIAKESLNLDPLPQVGSFGEKLTGLFLATDGSAAIGIVENGEVMPDDKRSFLQRLDFQGGQAGQLVAMPDESVLLDADPRDRVVVLRGDKFGNGKNARVYVQRLADGELTPLVDWAANPPEAFLADNDGAWLLADERLMTRAKVGQQFVVWDRTNARALFSIDVGWTPFDIVAVGQQRRYVAISSRGGVYLIDTLEGEHVATVEPGFDSIKAIALNGAMDRLAVWGGGYVAAWDLENGEELFRVAAPRTSWSDELGWMDDLLLVGGKHLIDPERRVTLWQYEVASAGHRQFVRPLAGRLWFAPVSERGLPLYVASALAPHDAVQRMRDGLGTPRELLLAKPGDTVFVTVDTDRGEVADKKLRLAVELSLKQAGYVVVRAAQADADALEAVVTCKSQPRQEIKINMSSSPIPDAWDIVNRTIRPYASRVAILRDGEEIWSDGWLAEPGHTIWMESGETIDDALKRLTSPNLDRLMNQKFASHLAKPGKATPEGAYGVSRLTSAGVATNYTGE